MLRHWSSNTDWIQAGGTVPVMRRWPRLVAAWQRRPHFARTELRSRGDTIVEVLIAIAIISFVLTAAYATTNKNTQATQNNQEHIQAQHLVEAQIEALRAQNGINTSGECFNGADEVAACNNFTAAGSGATYSVKVAGPTGLTTPTDGSPRTYIVTATWTSLGAQTNNDSNISMVYRLN